jgi:hypothetical protein
MVFNHFTHRMDHNLARTARDAISTFARAYTTGSALVLCPEKPNDSGHTSGIITLSLVEYWDYERKEAMNEIWNLRHHETTRLAETRPSLPNSSRRHPLRPNVLSQQIRHSARFFFFFWGGGRIREHQLSRRVSRNSDIKP